MEESKRRLVFGQRGLENIKKNGALLILLLLLGFIMPRMIPGSPVLSFQEDVHVLNQVLHDEAFNRFDTYYAPDQPLYRQFIIYVHHLIKGDLGYSFYYGYPVMEIILGRLHWTLILSFLSILFSFFMAAPLGLASGMKPESLKDHSLLTGNIFLQSIPTFMIAIILQQVFAYHLGWFPSQGAFTIGVTKGSWAYYQSVLHHMILPLAAGTLAMVPSNYLLMRNVVMAVKERPYVQLAMFNGVDRRTIRWHYILRSGLPEIMGKYNIHFIYGIAGTIFVEMVFSYPGLGMLMKNAISARDYPLIQGVLLFVGVYAIIINLTFEYIIRRVSPKEGYDD